MNEGVKKRICRYCKDKAYVVGTTPTGYCSIECKNASIKIRQYTKDDVHTPRMTREEYLKFKKSVAKSKAKERKRLKRLAKGEIKLNVSVKNKLITVKQKDYRIATQEFYSSRAWLNVRYRVLKYYGKKCMCCGSEGNSIHVDHIKPLSKYWALRLDFNNLQVLCKDCNFGKSNTDMTDFRPQEHKNETSDVEYMAQKFGVKLK